MKIGRVVGTVVSTIHVPWVDGKRLLMVDLLDLAGEPTGRSLIAIDAVDAGAGETVLLLDEGNGAHRGKTAQTRGRLTPLCISRFEEHTDPAWIMLLRNLECKLALLHAKDGMLGRHASYLHKRSYGLIGILMLLVRRAVLAAIEGGQEHIDEPLLEAIALAAKYLRSLLKDF